MGWFTAHALIWYRLERQPQPVYPVWENLILVKARTSGEAFEKTERIAREEESLDDNLIWNGQRAERVFAGIRKAVTVDDLPDDIGDGVLLDGREISYSYLEVHRR